MTTERLQDLISRYLANGTSVSEEQELFELIQEGKYDETIKDLLKDNWDRFNEPLAADEDRADRMLRYILDQREAAVIRPWYKTVLFRRLAAAAVIISFLFAAGFYLLQQNTDQANLSGKDHPAQTTADIAPGRNGAILKLADGSSIVLDSITDGIVSNEGNTVARKEGTTISYEQDGLQPDNVVYNTIETPRGRQFRLTLADGTRVWLNALSSIRFPVVFNGKDRPVDITGEVYFEVAKNIAKPFIVHTAGMQVRVLGTHFNVNAYTDGTAIRTTLIEGSVKVSKDMQTRLLSPGQQAQLSTAGRMSIQEHADIEEVMAWKNGRIAFTNAGIEDIMRQVSKWYDVEVVYAGPITKRTFTADISRNTNLSEFLKVLELSKIHFSIEGRKLVVKP